MKLYYLDQKIINARVTNEDIIRLGNPTESYFEVFNQAPVIGGYLGLGMLHDLFWLSGQSREETKSFSDLYIYDGEYLSGDFLLYDTGYSSIRPKQNLGDSITYSGRLDWSLAKDDDTLFVQNREGILFVGNWNQRNRHYSEFYRKKVNAYWAEANAALASENTISAAIAVKFEGLLLEADRVATAPGTGFGTGIQNGLIAEYAQYFNGDPEADDLILQEGATSAATRVKAARQQVRQIKDDATPQGSVYNTEQELVAAYQSVLDTLNAGV